MGQQQQQQQLLSPVKLRLPPPPHHYHHLYAHNGAQVLDAAVSVAAIAPSGSIGFAPARPPPPLVSESLKRGSRSRSISYGVAGAMAMGIASAISIAPQQRQFSVPVISTKL